MYTEILYDLKGKKFNMWQDFLQKASLYPGKPAQTTVLIMDNDRIAATGSREGNILKYIAVDDAYQGDNLTSTIVSVLRKDAFENGHSHLFVYTKPQNEIVFSSMFFHTVIKTDDVLLMESQKDGIKTFVDSIPKAEGENGAIVANCNPFTNGHLYLVQEASKRCDNLYLFILSENKSMFSSDDRMEMAKRATKDIPNVIVVPTGPYLVSMATFPDYFLKSNPQKAKCTLDAEIFAKIIAPKLNITKRFVGTEPICPVTAQYNSTLLQILPEHNISVDVIPRKEADGMPISARYVREYIKQNDFEMLVPLVPKSTLEFLKGR